MAPTDRLDDDDELTLTLFLRHRTPLPLDAIHGGTHTPLTPAQFEAQHGSGHHHDAVRAWAAANGFVVSDAQARRGTVRLTGTAHAIRTAFGVTLSWVDHRGERVHTHDAEPAVPEALEGIVEQVVGTDGRARVRRHATGGADPQPTSPVAIAELYGFPEGAGDDQVIALIQFMGGVHTADLDTFFASLSMKPTVELVEDGGTNSPSGSHEATLDTEIAAAVAPAARVRTIFAKADEQGLVDAISHAIHHDTHPATVVSMSFGGGEHTWTSHGLAAFERVFGEAATLGIPVLASTGDTGSTDDLDNDGHRGTTVAYPACSPLVLAVGGTQITVDGDRITTETVWSDDFGAGGGGVSEVMARPTWQSDAGVPKAPNGHVGRGIPDVAALSTPTYRLYANGGWINLGGTSAATPLLAGVVARIQAAEGRKLGLLQPSLYKDATRMVDVVSGSNGAYSAGPGWDACSGLGVPRGSALDV